MPMAYGRTKYEYLFLFSMASIWGGGIFLPLFQGENSVFLPLFQGFCLGFCRFSRVLRNCFEIFVRWLEMDFRGGFDCFLSKFSKLNVEKNNRKRPKRRSKHEQRTQSKTISVKF